MATAIQCFCRAIKCAHVCIMLPVTQLLHNMSDITCIHLCTCARCTLNLPNCFYPTSTPSRLLFCSVWICLLRCQYTLCITSLQFPGYQYLCGLQSSTFSLLLPTSYISNTSISCMYTAAQVRSGVMSSPLSRWLPSPPRSPFLLEPLLW